MPYRRTIGVDVLGTLREARFALGQPYAVVGARDHADGELPPKEYCSKQAFMLPKVLKAYGLGFR